MLWLDQGHSANLCGLDSRPRIKSCPDARIAAPLVVIGMSNLSYTDVSSSPTRIYNALAANTAQPGGMASLGAEVGLLPRLSILAMGQMGFGGLGPSPNAGMIAGVRVQLTPAQLADLPPRRKRGVPPRGLAGRRL